MAKFICSWCKIKFGFSKIENSHGICPACEAKFFPAEHKHEFKIYRDKKICYQKGWREYFVWQPKISLLCGCGEGRVIKW